MSNDNHQVFEDQFEADDFNALYRCSACWGILVKQKKDDGKYTCLCENCKENTPGYVTSKYVDRQFEKNLAEASEARYILRNFMPKREVRKETESEILHSLGF